MTIITCLEGLEDWRSFLAHFLINEHMFHQPEFLPLGNKVTYIEERIERMTYMHQVLLDATQLHLQYIFLGN